MSLEGGSASSYTRRHASQTLQMDGGGGGAAAAAAARRRRPLRAAAAAAGARARAKIEIESRYVAAGSGGPRTVDQPPASRVPCIA
jgi:hypothetical protein